MDQTKFGELHQQQRLVAAVPDELQEMLSIGVLSEQSAEALGCISEELEHTMLTVQCFRTRPEMENSVLVDAKFPTPDAKYWQAVREQNVMFVNLVELSFEYRQTAEKVKILHATIARLSDQIGDAHKVWERTMIEAKKRMAQIKIERHEFHMTQMRLVAEHRAREILEWSDIKQRLLPVLQHGTQDPGLHQPGSYLLRFNQAVGMNEHAGWKGAGTSEVVNLLAQFDNLRRDKRNAKLAAQLNVNEKHETRQLDQIDEAGAEAKRRKLPAETGTLKLVTM